jgi:hypothetical protein
MSGCAAGKKEPPAASAASRRRIALVDLVQPVLVDLVQPVSVLAEEKIRPVASDRAIKKRDDLEAMLAAPDPAELRRSLAYYLYCRPGLAVVDAHRGSCYLSMPTRNDYAGRTILLTVRS